MNNTNIDDLKRRANQIKNETQEGANTADRVGGLMYDMIGGVEDALNVELNDLSDVEISNPSNDQVITYDSGTRRWKNSAVPGGGGGGGGSIGKEKMYFLNRTHSDYPPTKPAVGNYNSSTDQFVVGGVTWTSTNINPGSNEDTWAVWVWFTDDTHPATISDPVRIYNAASGGGGGNGEDGEEVEFIYCRSITEFDANTKAALSAALAAFTNGGTKVTADVNVGGVIWSNHPNGVSQETKYEYSAVRHSSLNSNGKRIWPSGFSGPYLWSSYGERGTDGDGVEYIFYVNDGTLPTVNLDPSTWTNDPDFQEPEYIRSGTGWEDEPATLQPGQTQWVSMRKKQVPEDGDGKIAYYQAYSSPVVWGRYALDGVAEGYVVDLSNENMPVGTSYEGEVFGYSNTCKVSVFHNGVPMTYNSATSAGALGPNEFGYTIGDTITRSDSHSATGITATKNNNVITVEADNVTEFANVNAFIPVSVILPSDKGTRDKTITMYGVPTGEAGQTIDLYVSAAAIKEDYYHQNAYPETLEIGVRIGKGDSIRLYKVGVDDQALAEMGYSFEYFYNGDSAHPFAVAAPFHPRTSSDQVTIETLTFTMKLNGTIIDGETLPYIHEPAPAIGLNAYDINPLSSSITKYNTGKVSGAMTFRITKTEGDTIKYLFPSGNNYYWEENPNNPSLTEEADENLVVNINGSSASPSYILQSAVFEVSIDDADFSVPYSQIILYSATHMPLRSLVVPFIMEGQSASQAINGVVTRFRNWDTLTSDGYGDVAIGALSSSDGVIYKDIILYEGEYFYIAPSYSGNLDPASVKANGTPMDNQGVVRDGYVQIPMLGDAAFQVLLAKYAYIENLTANEIVITKNNKPVAGMTRGTAVDADHDPLNGATRNNQTGTDGVRIWAGYSDTGNLYNSKFYVTEKGFLHAEDTEIKGDIYTQDESVNLFSTGEDYSDSKGLQIKTAKDLNTTAELVSTNWGNMTGGKLEVRSVDTGSDSIQATSQVEPGLLAVYDGTAVNGNLRAWMYALEDGGHLSIQDGNAQETINMNGLTGTIACNNVVGLGGSVPVAMYSNLRTTETVVLPSNPTEGMFVFCIKCRYISADRNIYSASGENKGTSWNDYSARPRIFVYDGSGWREFYCGKDNNSSFN